MDQRVYWLWLVLVFGPADPRIWVLSKDYADVRDFVDALQNDRIINVDKVIKERIEKFSLDSASEIIEHCEEAGINVYSYESEGYPNKLREIANPPAVIFVKGSLDFLEKYFLINVAGTRSPSEYSKKINTEICKGLCRNGCVIVSGLAEGIDTLAARTSVECEQFTLGVCGSEIDLFDEKSDEFIASVIKNGAIISETCTAMGVVRPKFSNRNRLITALSDAVVFVEGALNSRGLDICEHAIAQGRFLFVVPPHDITEKRYQGQSWLIRRGCKPLFSVQDVLYYIAHLSVDQLDYSNIAEDYADIGDYSFFIDESPDSSSKTRKSSNIKNSVSEDTDDENVREYKNTDLSALDDISRSICEALVEKPLLADAIAAKLDADISTVLSKLTMLEVEGYIESLPGKQFGLI